jgi:glyoxylase-like metal-dependent hydrolase (beta-lactamase superfamily II)
MANKTEHGWQIIDERVWIYVYPFAKHATANCCAVRLQNGHVVVLSPAAGLSEAAYADLAQLGEVTALVATNGHHHLGIGAFRQRFPGARVYARRRWPHNVSRRRTPRPVRSRRSRSSWRSSGTS